jgi:hypothetical protein
MLYVMLWKGIFTMTEQIKDALLPCPFCGHAHQFKALCYGDESFIKCLKCGAETKPYVWNTRPPSQSQARVDKLVAALRWYADAENYVTTYDNNSPADYNDGQRAREALKEFEG